MKSSYSPGQKFVMLTLLSRSGSDKNRNVFWKCRCDCGNEKIILIDNIKRGKVKSCGCLNSKLSSDRLLTHGLSKTKEYKAWAAMKERCYNPNYIQFYNYGGRGISVCDRWLNSFENFINDMGNSPSVYHSIDRKNGDLNYTPDNCRWADRKTQNRNRKRLKLSIEIARIIRSSKLTNTDLGKTYSVDRHLIASVRRNEIWKE